MAFFEISGSYLKISIVLNFWVQAATVNREPSKSSQQCYRGISNVLSPKPVRARCASWIAVSFNAFQGAQRRAFFNGHADDPTYPIEHMLTEVSMFETFTAGFWAEQTTHVARGVLRVSPFCFGLELCNQPHTNICFLQRSTKANNKATLYSGVFCKELKTSAVSTTDWMVGSQICNLRGTSDTLDGRAYSIFHW